MFRLHAACVLAALCLAGCGRLGFDALRLGDDVPEPRRDAGRGPRGGDDSGAQPPFDDAGGSPSAEAGMPPPVDGSAPGMDAALDAAQPDALVDAALDAAQPDATPDAVIDAAEAGPRCAAPSASSFCDALPGLPDAPVIDGLLECGLSLQPVAVKNWTSTTPIAADHSARMAAAWRPDGLYVFVDVDDATRLPALSTLEAWCGDSIEVYVDSDGSYLAPPAYDNPGTVQLVAVAPEDDSTTVVRGARYRDGATLTPWGGSVAGVGSNFATFPKPGGYVLEAFIVAADLDLTSMSLGAGDRVGFDLGVNLSISSDPPPGGETPDCGRRLGQYFYNVVDALEPDCTDSLCKPWRTPAAYCTPTLLN